MSRAIHFHDGSLVAHELGEDGSLHLQIQLDPVWNNGSDRIVDIRLLDISDVSEVRQYFGTTSSSSSAPFERKPTVMGLEFLRVGMEILVSLDLLFLGGLDVLCQGIQCDERPSLHFVGED